MNSTKQLHVFSNNKILQILLTSRWFINSAFFNIVCIYWQKYIALTIIICYFEALVVPITLVLVINDIAFK